MKSLAEPVRQSDGFRVAKDFNCFAGGIHHQPALLAALQVLVEFGEPSGIQLAIQIAGKFFDYSAAVHAFSLR